MRCPCSRIQLNSAVPLLHKTADCLRDRPFLTSDQDFAVHVAGSAVKAKIKPRPTVWYWRTGANSSELLRQTSSLRPYPHSALIARYRCGFSQVVNKMSQFCRISVTISPKATGSAITSLAAERGAPPSSSGLRGVFAGTTIPISRREFPARWDVRCRGKRSRAPRARPCPIRFLHCLLSCNSFRC